jgi:hypothetical protein
LSNIYEPTPEDLIVKDDEKKNDLSTSGDNEENNLETTCNFNNQKHFSNF